MPAGRPKGSGSLFTQPIADEICERISRGEALTVVSCDLNIHRNTIYDWQLQFKHFAVQFARARKLEYDTMAEECRQIADNVDEDPASRRVRVETRLRLLAKLDPTRFGDKIALEHSGQIDSKVTTVTAADRAARIKSRLEKRGEPAGIHGLQ